MPAEGYMTCGIPCCLAQEKISGGVRGVVSSSWPWLGSARGAPALMRRGVCFVHYMDDIQVLTPTRWALRRAVRLVHTTLRDLGLETQSGNDLRRADREGLRLLGLSRDADGPHGGPPDATAVSRTGTSMILAASAL